MFSAKKLTKDLIIQELKSLNVENNPNYQDQLLEILFAILNNRSVYYIINDKEEYFLFFKRSDLTKVDAF
jgi:hypothetical protein